MPIFEYHALDSQGKAIRGTLQSPSLDLAAQNLAAKGLKLQQIGFAQTVGDPLSGAPPPGTVQTPFRPIDLPPRTSMESGVWGELFGKVKLADLSFFFRQLGSMLNAGVNPAETFDTLAMQTNKGKLQTVILEMKDNSLSGKPMSLVMERYPEVFSPLMIGLIRAGESGGFLDKACHDTALYTEQEIEIRNMIRRETMYPKILLFAAVFIFAGANLFIQSLGRSSMLDAPLNRLSTWIWLGPLVIGLFLFFRLIVPSPKFRPKWDEFLLKIPYLGQTVHRFAMAKFGRVFGAGYRGGMLIHESLRMAADSCGNEYVRAQLYPAIARMEAGAGISDALQSTGILGPIVSKMISTGERTGNLDAMLNKMAEYYEDEAKTSSKQMALVLGVVVFLVIAIYIGSIVISFWSNYFGSQFKTLEE